jgi:hypothetical protein
MRRFLVLVGWVLNDHYWERLPKWERLYLSNVWATREARSRFKYQIPAMQSKHDRVKAAGFAARSHAKLRTKNFPAYLWVRKGMYTRTST